MHMGQVNYLTIGMDSKDILIFRFINMSHSYLRMKENCYVNLANMHVSIVLFIREIYG